MTFTPGPSVLSPITCMLVELIDLNGCGQKVNSQLCHSQASTDEGLEGELLEPMKGSLPSIALLLSLHPPKSACDWVSMTDLAPFGWFTVELKPVKHTSFTARPSWACHGTFSSLFPLL